MRLKTVCSAVGFVLMGILAGSAGGQQRGGGNAEGPAWRLGVQAYSFNRFTFFEAIDKVQSLGLHYIEAYPGQRLRPEQPDVKFDHTAPLSVLAAVKIKLEAANVHLACYGVVRLGADEAKTRAVFDFAKVMGIETIVSEPAPDAFDLLDNLTAEYDINVSIHNHPKPSRYWDPDSILLAIEGHSRRIGACADTGHWMRSGVNPVEALRKLEGHIISLHFKDLNELGRRGHDVPFGTGKGDVRAMLAELNRQNFRGVFSIEYEHNWNHSVPDIAKCVAFFRQTAQALQHEH